VARQRLLAGLADPGAVLLQAGQYDLVSVVHLGPAKARDVARAGIFSLLPLLLRLGDRGDQNQGMTKRNLVILLCLQSAINAGERVL
jgi:hypothetical protein